MATKWCTNRVRTDLEKCLNFSGVLKKCLIFNFALKMMIFPGKVIENDNFILEKITHPDILFFLCFFTLNYHKWISFQYKNKTKKSKKAISICPFWVIRYFIFFYVSLPWIIINESHLNVKQKQKKSQKAISICPFWVICDLWWITWKFKILSSYPVISLLKVLQYAWNDSENVLENCENVFEKVLEKCLNFFL